MENHKEEVKENFWKCSKCGYTLHAKAPPEVCPSCSEKCQFFDVTSYLPDEEGSLDERL